jgi:hypothetical protein
MKESISTLIQADVASRALAVGRLSQKIPPSFVGTRVCVKSSKPASLSCYRELFSITAFGKPRPTLPRYSVCNEQFSQTVGTRRDIGGNRNQLLARDDGLK